MKTIFFIIFQLCILNTLFANGNNSSNENNFENDNFSFYTNSIPFGQNSEIKSVEYYNIQKRRRRRRGGRGRNEVAPFGFWFNYGGTNGLFGIDLSYLINPNFEIHGSGGLGFSGAIIGGGVRYYFMESKGSPYAGAHIMRASGLDNIEVTVNQNVGFYNVKSNMAMLLNGGYRYAWRRFGIKAGIGYGIRFKSIDESLEFIWGDEEATRKTAETAVLGGFNFEFGMGILLGSYSR